MGPRSFLQRRRRSKIGGLSKQDQQGDKLRNAARSDLKDHISNFPTEVESSKQKAHILGTREFTQKLISLRTRAERVGEKPYPSQSFLTIDLKEAEKLVATSRGHGVVGETVLGKWDHTELCEAPEIIGAVVLKSGEVIYTK